MRWETGVFYTDFSIASKMPGEDAPGSVKQKIDYFGEKEFLRTEII
ncbi:hypothetical protein JCM17039_09370 [Blautia glucerasea]